MTNYLRQFNEMRQQVRLLTREMKHRGEEGATALRRLDEMRQQLQKQSETVRKLKRSMDGIDQVRQHLRDNAETIRSLERVLARSQFKVSRTRIERYLRRLAASGRPIIVGPWYGEIGFEAIAWAPFVRWALITHGFDMGKVSLVARGGSRDLYGLDVPYVDLFNFVKPNRLREQKGEYLTQKQDSVRSLDRQLARSAARQLGLTRPSLLHPSMMYAALAPLWADAIPAQLAMTVLKPCRATPPRHAEVPEDYVAARFYSSKAFPDSPENREVASAALQALAKENRVVLLQSSTRFDDHGDVAVTVPDGVQVIDMGADPATNIGVQASVAAHARQFISTYGGGAYLAAVCGTPVVAVWSKSNWRRHHLALALEVFHHTNGGRFSVMSTAEFKLLIG
ncbi:MAG: hypothetical protein HY824_05165 [Acidobacteria bacterium]|nr:hypothetical protein [Acidobacteriota bacterium]